MQFKHSKIDPKTASREEIKAEIERLTHQAKTYGNIEQSVKVFINSVYGALASQFFIGYNIKIAEAITLQGQELTKYAATILDKYFQNHWHKDKELHKKLGITKPVEKVNNPVIKYGDTDSCHKDTVIRTDKGNFTIEELYNSGNGDMGNTLKGHESVSVDKKVLNWSDELCSFYFAVPKRIIRHKVSKKKFKVTTESGKTVYVTEDHSLVFYRNAKQIKGTVHDAKPDDKILSVFEFINIENISHKLESFTIEQCEDFEDEYVYDIEIDDETHTFVANDMLIHNSVYGTFEEVVKSCGWEGDGTEFVLGLYHGRLTEYIQKCFDIFAEKYKTNNIQALELEKISASAIILAKKKYVLDLVWKDPGVTYNPQENLASSGIEIVQSSTPSFVRKHLNELLKIIFNEKKQLNIKKFVQELKTIKENFILCDVEDISKSTSIGDYEKFITQDKERLVIEPRCPIHVRAGGNYNYILNNSKWKNKYQLIKSSDKIRWFHSKPERQGETDVFAYQPGNFPHEFAPKIDYDTQFEKTIIDPINRFMVAMGYGKIPSNLIASTRLF